MHHLLIVCLLIVYLYVCYMYIYFYYRYVRHSFLVCVQYAFCHTLSQLLILADFVVVLWIGWVLLLLSCLLMLWRMWFFYVWPLRACSQLFQKIDFGTYYVYHNELLIVSVTSLAYKFALTGVGLTSVSSNYFM